MQRAVIPNGTLAQSGHYAGHSVDLVHLLFLLARIGRADTPKLSRLFFHLTPQLAAQDKVLLAELE